MDPGVAPARPTFARLETGLALAVAVLALATAWVGRVRVTVDPDELGHLHAAWLWRVQGVQPYAGFFINHQPGYWLALAPQVMGRAPHDLLAVLVAARTLSWAFLALLTISAGALFSELFGRRQATWGVALWAAFAATSDPVVQVRPDMLYLLLAVTGTTLAVQGLDLGRQRDIGRPLARAFAGGVLMGCAAVTSIKSAFWILPLLAGSIVLAAWRAWTARSGVGAPAGSSVRAVGALLAGVAVPCLLLVAWVFAENDPAAFWFCNVGVHARLAGSSLRTLAGTHTAFGAVLGWPMLCLPLAAVGAAAQLSRPDSRERLRMGLALVLLAGSAGVLLAAVGPWPQYGIPLALVVTGLSGAGWCCAVEGLAPAARIGAAGAMTMVAVAWIAMLGGGRWERPGAVRNELSPFQFVLDHAREDDTYLTLTQATPVFMMDAEPRLYDRLVCDDREGTLEGMLRAMRDLRPRWVVGVGLPYWSSAGHMASVSKEQIGPGWHLVAPFVMERD